MATATAFQPPQVSPLSSEVSTTLNVSASVAFEIFSDVGELPRWLPILQGSRVLDRDDSGRAARVAFTRKLERGSLGYTLEYTYNSDTLTVTWSTPDGSNVVLGGEARFVPLSSRACLMLYRLVIDLPIVDDLVAGELDGHPASVVVAEFREHLRRLT
jgi:ribosome-associated toxin RatA of RatAB toxin-antitoxin module